MQPLLDFTPLDEAPTEADLPAAAPIVSEYDDDYYFSPFAGIGAFLTGQVDLAAVRATFRSARGDGTVGGPWANGHQQLADLLDDTCLGRVA